MKDEMGGKQEGQSSLQEMLAWGITDNAEASRHFITSFGAEIYWPEGRQGCV